jgi:predicted PurR-regulated permease PerM
VVQVEIAPRTIGLVLATLGGLWLLHQLWITVLLVVVALVFAGTLNPVIEWMERRGLTRALALVLVLVASLLSGAFLIFLTVPPLLSQLSALVQGAPAAREQLAVLLSGHGLTEPLSHLVRSAKVVPVVEDLQSHLVSWSSQVVAVLGYFGTTVVLAVYMLADGKRTQGALYAIVPRAYHMRLARILHNLETIVGGYMRGQLITSAVIGLFVFALLVACRVPHALSLALFAALADVLPFVGGLLAIGPAFLSALPRGVGVASVVLAAMVLYMEFESRVLVPKVYGRVLRLSPISVVLALIAGGTLLGIMGALLALPIAAGLQMILEELRVELPGDDSDDREARARNAKTEATYERMSAGTAAPEAGQIARNLAQDLRDAEVAAAEQRAAQGAVAPAPAPDPGANS